MFEYEIRSIGFLTLHHPTRLDEEVVVNAGMITHITLCTGKERYGRSFTEVGVVGHLIDVRETPQQILNAIKPEKS
jgi:hypothetical protein